MRVVISKTDVNRCHKLLRGVCLCEELLAWETKDYRRLRGAGHVCRITVQTFSAFRNDKYKTPFYNSFAMLTFTGLPIKLLKVNDNVFMRPIFGWFSRTAIVVTF